MGAPCDAVGRWCAATSGGCCWRSAWAPLPITLLQNGPTLVQTFTFDSDRRSRGPGHGRLYGVTLLLRVGVLPWVLVLVTLLYFDLRLRHGERLDPGAR